MSQVDPTSATHQRRPFYTWSNWRASAIDELCSAAAACTADRSKDILTISLDALRRHEPRFIFASASVKSERTSLRCVEESLL